MDQFGQEIIMINKQWINLHRSILCKKVYKDTDSLIVSKVGPCSYNIKPHIFEKGYTDKESLYKVKQHIWFNFFNFGEKYPYTEERHYPHIFSVYLKEKLDIDITGQDRLDLFIEHVRNHIFVHVTYTCSPDLVAVANWASDGTLRMESIKKYVIAVKSENWLKQ